MGLAVVRCTAGCLGLYIVQGTAASPIHLNLTTLFLCTVAYIPVFGLSPYKYYITLFLLANTVFTQTGTIDLYAEDRNQFGEWHFEVVCKTNVTHGTMYLKC